MGQPNDSERFERFVRRVTSIIGAAPEIREVPPRVPEDGRVYCLVYADKPEAGFVTGITYGLSSLPDSPGAGRELCITMNSGDPAWAMVPALTVAALRGMCPFDPGMVIGYMKPYVEGSQLSSLVLGAPDPRLALGARIGLAPELSEGADDFVEVIGAYPIYASERKSVQAHGLGVLWNSDWNPSDPSRPSLF